MTVVIAVVFIVCWTPYNTIVVWFMIDKESFRSAIIDQRLQNTLFLFACLSSVMDPIVYGFFHVRNNSRRPSQVKFKYSPQGAVIRVGGCYESSLVAANILLWTLISPKSVKKGCKSIGNQLGFGLEDLLLWHSAPHPWF